MSGTAGDDFLLEWWRVHPDGRREKIEGAVGDTYTLTRADLGCSVQPWPAGEMTSGGCGPAGGYMIYRGSTANAIDSYDTRAEAEAALWELHYEAPEESDDFVAIGGEGDATAFGVKDLMARVDARKSEGAA